MTRDGAASIGTSSRDRAPRTRRLRPSDAARRSLGVLDAGVRDGGLYLLVLQLARDVRIEVGALGLRTFPRGFYVYTGSAQRGLSQRIARHLRRRKRFHWHVDFLRECSARVQAFPIRGSSGECELAAAVAGMGGELVAGFGASDCRCPGHLVRFPEAPVHTAAFQELLTRMRHRPAAAMAADSKT